MQRGVHFDPLRLPLLGGCACTGTYGTSVRRYVVVVVVVVVDVDAGVDLCDLLPGGWLSARLDSTRLDVSVRGTLGVDCVYSGVLCCAVLCASTTLLLLRSVVRVRARASHRRETCCACGRPCCVRCCHTVVWWWWMMWLVWHRRDKSAGDLSLYFTSPACASM